MQVALHTPTTIYAWRHVPSWLLLAGAAGFVNGFAFLACQQFVTNVTGTVTQAGLEWPRLGVAAEYLVIYLSFVAGAAAAVVVIQRRARVGKRDRWATPLWTVALILAGVAAAGHAGGLEPLGSHLSDPPPFLLLSLLAFAAGLQNAAVASTTGMAVRTTHLTGPTTDMGMLLGAACLAGGAERRAALGGAGLRFGVVVAFMAGAGLALPFMALAGYLALLVPAGFVVVAGALSFMPDWSPSDIPYPKAEPAEPAATPELLVAIPADARPPAEEVAAPARSPG